MTQSTITDILQDSICRLLRKILNKSLLKWLDKLYSPHPPKKNWVHKLIGISHKQVLPKGAYSQERSQEFCSGGPTLNTINFCENNKRIIAHEKNGCGED